jgi:hypothetical protein
MTVVLSLSMPGEAFQGGGTTFWEQAPALGRGGALPGVALPRGAEVECRPPPGTAMLFNGTIRHAGRPVTSGVRHLYVASFDLE